MNVFVSGATGFIGEALVRGLVADGSTVRALVHPAADPRVLTELGATTIAGDVRHPDAVAEAIAGCEVAYHLAALVPGAGRTPEEYHSVNVQGTENVIRAAMENGVRHLVYCSTVSVHGIPRAGPADEGTALVPLNAYGATKLEAERVVRRLARERFFSAVIIRPAALYGPGDVRNARLFRDVSRRRLSMIGRGRVRCQLAYIDDVVAALRLAGARRPSGVECFIVAGTEQPTVDELVRLIAAEAGVALRAVRLPAMPFRLAARLRRAIADPARTAPGLVDRWDFFTAERIYDTRRAACELGFRPRVSLREGIRRTLAWYRSRDLL